MVVSTMFGSSAARRSWTRRASSWAMMSSISPSSATPVCGAAAAPEPPPEMEPAAEPQAGVALDGEMLDIIAHELTRRVSERLAAELPGIIESTVRDFLAEPEILAVIQPRD